MEQWAEPNGVVVCAVPWARHQARFTRAFEDQVAWLAVHCSQSATAELMRVARPGRAPTWLEEDGVDFPRGSLKWVVQQVMEVEVSQLIGAELGERRPVPTTGRYCAGPPAS